MRPHRAVLTVLVAVILVGCGGGGGADRGGGGGAGGNARAPGALFVETTTSDRLIAVDIHTGRPRTLPIRLDCGDAEFCLVPSGGRLVIGSVGRTYVDDPAAPGHPRRHRIGSGWIVIPSANDGRIWLGLLNETRRKLRAVREETVNGRVTQSVRPPGGDWPARIMRAGFLFQTARALRLWDPKTRQVTFRVPGSFPVDTYGNLVAWCGEPCPRFDITDVRTGTTTRVPPPAGFAFRAGYDGALSPDGSLLAVPVAADRRRPHANHGGLSMALVDVARGTARVIKGATVDPVYHAVSWSPSGDRLFFGAGGGRIMAYDPGASRATVLARVRLRSAGSIIHMAAL
jgi:hypothetical protein